MIALVPHIVRTPDYTAENLRGIYAGTDQVVKINYAPKADVGGDRPCKRRVRSRRLRYSGAASAGIIARAALPRGGVR